MDWDDTPSTECAAAALDHEYVGLEEVESMAGSEPKPGQRRSHLFAWNACIAAQTRPPKAEPLEKSLSRLAETKAGAKLTEVIREFDDTPDGVSRALQIFSPLKAIVNGEISGREWAGPLWPDEGNESALAQGEELLALTQAALWANDAANCARPITPLNYIGCYGDLVEVHYFGDRQHFDAFLLDSFAAGAPFPISDANTALHFPIGISGNSWLRPTQKQIELLCELVGLCRRSGQSLGVKIIYLGDADGDAKDQEQRDLLVETPNGVIYLGFTPNDGDGMHGEYWVRHQPALGEYYTAPLQVEVDGETFDEDPYEDSLHDLHSRCADLAEIAFDRLRSEEKARRK